MRQLSLFAVVMAVLSAGTGAWIGASVLSPLPAQVDTLQLMLDAGSLPTERVVDYSLVFE